ncbi:MAG: type II secretion system protein GspM [Pseudomonadota bacterium]
MSDWWSNLAARERVLIAIAGLLTVIVIGWQFVLLPTMTARAEASVRLAEADRTLSRIQQSYILQRAIGAASPINARPTSSGIDEFRASITSSASEIGLAIARLQGNDPSSVRLVFEDADPRLIFLWLENIQARYSAQIVRFSMDQAGSGLVRVNVDVAPGGL